MTTTRRAQDVGASVPAAAEFFRLPDIPEKHPDDMTSFQHLAATGNVSNVAQYLGDPDTTIVSGERYIVPGPAYSASECPYPDLLVALGVNRAAYQARNGYMVSEQGKPPDFILEVGSRHTASADLGVKNDVRLPLNHKHREDIMARTPTVTRESVPENEQAAFDAFVADRGEVPATGPGSVMLNAPEVAQRALGLALYLRTDTSLDPRIRELAMLLAARENDCQFIWNAHAPPARRAGLRDEIVDALRDKQEIPNPAADESAVINYGREFFRTRRVSQEAFDAVLEQFGRNGATELTTLMGCYAMLAFNVNAFGVELPDNITEAPLPI